MKIIQPGQINEQSPDWWVGKRLTCSSCRCIFELEVSDEVSSYAERRLGGVRSVTAPCPTCDVPVTYREGGDGAGWTFNANPIGLMTFGSRRIEPTTMDTAGTVTGPGDVTVI